MSPVAFQSTQFLNIYEIFFRLKQSFTTESFEKSTLIYTILFLIKKKRIVYIKIILVPIERREYVQSRGVRLTRIFRIWEKSDMFRIGLVILLLLCL